jgi:aspartate/methionine/tyrosine aminotransferase
LSFSSRSETDRSPNALTIAARRAKEAKRTILDLTESNPTRAGIPYAGSVPSVLGDSRGASYDPLPFGLLVARRAVSRTLQEEVGVDIDPSRIVLTASTSEAYGFLFKLLCDPGDDVLVPQPSYPLFEHIARLEGVRLSPYALAYDGQWHVDIASARRARGARTRAAIVVHPNNPTGSYVKREELAALAALGLPIVSDEVFSSFPLRADSRRTRSALDHESGLVFALGGLSKMAALPQMKLAWICVGGEEVLVREACSRLELIADSYLSVNTAVQLAAPALLESRHVAADAIRARLRKNLARASTRALGTPASVLAVEGGWYATLRLPCTRAEEDWALAFLEEDGVYVHPGHFFDFASEAYVVTSLLTPESVYDEGIARIVARAAH